MGHLESPLRPWPGEARPLGATWDGEGVNFAVSSENAERIDLCLFDAAGTETVLPLEDVNNHIWHGYVPHVTPGQRYGFRAHGRWEPAAGLWFNPTKLLLDPYARAIEGDFVIDDAVFAGDHRAPDPRDSAPFVPRSVVVAEAFPWGDDRHPKTPWADTVIYEAHVRGLTMTHPEVPDRLRGTYAGLAHPAVVGHLLDLGVTAVELMPVHHLVTEPAVQRRGLINYWGYNTIGFFAPHGGYAASPFRGDQVREFKAMVRALHSAGLEVILDVVYNHTAEGDGSGPVLSFRGLDNPTYYRLLDGQRDLYADYTGCGNTVDVRRPFTLQLMMDSLRYWVTEMHVDGFRFDLASALARSLHDVDMLSAVMLVISQDPVISAVKLIAEPWDVGPGGYQVGQFPPGWTEWNGRYRDTVRDFWRGATDGLGDLGFRLSGSADLYQDDGRRPFASINFVTAHDGFSLRDLVTFERKRNEANLEDNRDGTDDNRSWNCGVEGPTDTPAVRELRGRQMRNLMLTLLLSTGVPMISHGDEVGKSRGGNNNPYCQDNETTWMEWAWDADAADLLAFTRALLTLRRRHSVFRKRLFYSGWALPDGTRDLAWFAADGREMTRDDWADSHRRSIGMYLSGQGIQRRGPRGEDVVDDSFLVVLNAADEPVDFALPGRPWADGYDVVVDTAAPTLAAGDGDRVKGFLEMVPHSATLLLARR